ncbi:MAG: Crp/Fnr family transcriptional regulator [Bacteroidia bacterium]|nr:Crp/Fnr family transcriptional regulator [Bacteroidia bacterium]
MKKPVKNIDCTTCQNMALSSFCTLKKDELSDLNDYKLTHRVKKNQLIFHEGDLAKGLHCVHQGKIKLYKTLHDGSTQILRLAKDGELIGYRGLLGDGHYIASGVAIEDSIVCFIPKERIFDLIKSNIKFTMEIMSRFAEDLSLAENKSVSFIQKDTRARLAETLLLLEKSFGKNNENFINIVLTREDMASIAGMATETAVRVLREWDDEKVILLFKKYIKIVDYERLFTIAKLED